ncbi:MAG: rRNA maturation RNase YbeY [Alphaproteobacteria bacterium]
MNRVTIEIRLAHPAWRSALPELGRRARRAARAALALARPLPAGRRAELALMFVDEVAMTALNREWRGKDRPTNVLAFAAQEAAGARAPAPPEAGPLLLGDVVLSYETIAREAEAASKPLADHLSHLIIHGVLHLLGYDHQRPREARAMETLEVQALKTLGIDNPYEAPPTTSRMVRAGRAMER